MLGMFHVPRSVDVPHLWTCRMREWGRWRRACEGALVDIEPHVRNPTPLTCSVFVDAGCFGHVGAHALCLNQHCCCVPYIFLALFGFPCFDWVGCLFADTLWSLRRSVCGTIQVKVTSTALSRI